MVSRAYPGSEELNWWQWKRGEAKKIRDSTHGELRVNGLVVHIVGDVLDLRVVHRVALHGRRDAGHGPRSGREAGGGGGDGPPGEVGRGSETGGQRGASSRESDPAGNRPQAAVHGRHVQSKSRRNYLRYGRTTIGEEIGWLPVSCLQLGSLGRWARQLVRALGCTFSLYGGVATGAVTLTFMCPWYSYPIEASRSSESRCRPKNGLGLG